MKQITCYGDERSLYNCAFCGGETGTRDHCPSRIFLDKPYPENLPVVPACSSCNSSFSSDEEYLACLISCTIAGSTNIDYITREKIKRILTQKPPLKGRIEQARSVVNGINYFQAEVDRVTSVFTKLAQGHSLFELHVPCIEKPREINIMPLSLMDSSQREVFEFPDMPILMPEVGSRMIQRLFTGVGLSEYGWIIVQSNRYRYHSSIDQGIDIRIVIHEYLSAQILWDY